jgi:hypothetical protein
MSKLLLHKAKFFCGGISDHRNKMMKPENYHFATCYKIMVLDDHNPKILKHEAKGWLGNL